MKTLVIHPQDKSTVFLKGIYELIPEEDKTVLVTGATDKEIRELIQSHDRVMMMGHGSPHGLFSVGGFKGKSPYLINKTHVELLNEKEDNVFIWCNADMFVTFYDLKGFYTGMFISEVGEAYYCGLPGTSQDLVEESNYGFTNILKNFVNEGKDVTYENVKREYGLLAENNPVAYYNYLRLYKR